MTVTIPEDIGQRVKAIRELTNHSIREFAEIVGKSEAAVRLWEKGAVQPAHDSLKQLARKMKCSLSDLTASTFDARKALGLKGNGKPTQMALPVSPPQAVEEPRETPPEPPQAAPPVPEVPQAIPQAISPVERARTRLLAWHTSERRRLLAEASITAAAIADGLGRNMDPNSDLIREQEGRLLELVRDYEYVRSEMSEDLRAIG